MAFSLAGGSIVALMTGHPAVARKFLVRDDPPSWPSPIKYGADRTRKGWNVQTSRGRGSVLEAADAPTGCRKLPRIRANRTTPIVSSRVPDTGLTTSGLAPLRRSGPPAFAALPGTCTLGTSLDV